VAVGNGKKDEPITVKVGRRVDPAVQGQRDRTGGWCKSWRRHGEPAVIQPDVYLRLRAGTGRSGNPWARGPGG